MKIKHVQAALFFGCCFISFYFFSYSSAINQPSFAECQGVEVIVFKLLKGRHFCSATSTFHQIPQSRTFPEPPVVLFSTSVIAGASPNKQSSTCHSKSERIWPHRRRIEAISLPTEWWQLSHQSQVVQELVFKNHSTFASVAIAYEKVGKQHSSEQSIWYIYLTDTGELLAHVLWI